MRAAKKIGLPGVLKTRRLGYDGKGQFVLREPAQIGEAWAAIGGTGLIYEKFQAFSREVSLVGARSAAGDTVFYPLSANVHRRRHFAIQRGAFCQCAAGTIGPRPLEARS